MTKGFTPVHLPDDLVEEMKKEAEKTHRSLPKYVEWLFKERQQEQEKKKWFII